MPNVMHTTGFWDNLSYTHSQKIGKANEFLRARKPKDINRIANRNVGRYLSGNQKPHSEEEQTTQWPKEKMDKQRSTKQYKEN